MKTIFTLIFIWSFIFVAKAQTESDTLSEKQITVTADDPSQFLTRLELFNELQHKNDDSYLNLSTLRTNVKIGKRFTTRLDVMYVYNTIANGTDFQKSGLGDISLRLLGYRIFQLPKSAMTASVEISLNTAQSAVLGTGKNLFIPMITYSKVFKTKKMLLSAVFQQVNSFSGDDNRANLSFSKIQIVDVNLWSKKMWTVIAPEFYIDYVLGGFSMNLEGRIAFAPSPRINFWVQAGAGIFGDFMFCYQLSAEVGYRYYLFRKSAVKSN
jgi:hypothetical protein